MRILHTLPALNRGGTERLVLALASHQQQQGHTVAVVTFDPLNLWPLETAGLHLEVFTCTKAIHRLLRPPVHDASSFTLFLEEWQPDVVHSHSHWTERILLACLRQRPVLIQHFHLDYEEWQRPRWLQIRQWFGRWQLILRHWQLGTRFLAVSQSTTAYYRRHLPPLLAKRLWCFPNFLALPIREEPRLKPRHPLKLLSVGRLVPEKRHDNLLLLASALVLAGVSFELNLVGEGPLRPVLQRQIHDLHLSRHVHCYGNQSDMVACYEDADLLLHPAPSEPFGLVILEAMARGLPCLVEESSIGPRDFIKAGVNGLFVQFSDVEACVRRLIWLFSSHEAYHRLSSEALKTCLDFSLKEYAIRLEHFYLSDF